MLRSPLRSLLSPLVLLALALGEPLWRVVDAQGSAGRDCAGCAAGRTRDTDALVKEMARLQSRVDQLARRLVNLQLADENATAGERADLQRELERLARQLTQAQMRLARDESMRALDDSAVQRTLRESIEQSARSLSLLHEQMAATMAHDMAEPRGWVGISYWSPSATEWTRRGMAIVHKAYPVVVSVEPGSPAQRAGLAAGDTLLAFNGVSVLSRAIVIDTLLVPGRRIEVRIRRDGDERTIPVTVSRRPMLAPPAALRMGQMPMPDVAPTPQPAVPAPPAPGVPAPRALGFAMGSEWALAGAELARMNDDLADVFGVSRGVLVLRVGHGTPAARAGLKGGDVIVSVDGTPIASPLGFQQALERSTDHAVQLDVIRKKRPIRVRLAW